MESVLRKEELCPAQWRPLSSCFSCRELILGVCLSVCLRGQRPRRHGLSRGEEDEYSQGGREGAKKRNNRLWKRAAASGKDLLGTTAVHESRVRFPFLMPRNEGAYLSGSKRLLFYGHTARAGPSGNRAIDAYES